MGFDWAKYLEFAEYISKNTDKMPDKEACCRASVSRAYYAAFCITHKYIRQTGADFDGGDAHRQVREYLKKDKGNKIKRKIANQLENLHFDRKKADYDDMLSEPPRVMAAKAIVKAQQIIEEVNSL